MNLPRTVLNTQHIVAHKLHNKGKFQMFERHVFEGGTWEAEGEAWPGVSLAEGSRDINLAEAPLPDYLYPPAKCQGHSIQFMTQEDRI